MYVNRNFILFLKTDYIHENKCKYQLKNVYMWYGPGGMDHTVCSMRKMTSVE